jgi:hypothetical protein
MSSFFRVTFKEKGMWFVCGIEFKGDRVFRCAPKLSRIAKGKTLQEFLEYCKDMEVEDMSKL